MRSGTVIQWAVSDVASTPVDENLYNSEIVSYLSGLSGFAVCAYAILRAVIARIGEEGSAVPTRTNPDTATVIEQSGV